MEFKSVVFAAILVPKLFYLLIIFTGLIMGMVLYRRLDRAYRLLTQLLALVFVSELISTVAAKEFGINYPVYHILLFAQIIYYGLIFSSLLTGYGKLRRRVLIAAAILTVTSLTVSFFFQSFYAFPSIVSSLFSIYVVGCSLLLFYKMIQIPMATPLLKQPAFWFNSATLIFYSVTFFVFGFFEYFRHTDQSMPKWCFELVHISNYLLYISYILSIYFAAKATQTKLYDFR